MSQDVDGQGASSPSTNRPGADGWRRVRRGLLALTLTAALIMPLLAAPPAALAASSGAFHRPYPGHMMHFGPGRMIHPFWMTGEVEEVTENSIKLLLEGRGHRKAMLRQFEWSVTLAVDEDSILLSEDFEQLDLAALEVGTPVVFVPRMVWGTLGVRLLYTGSAQELSDATYIGRATVIDENTLRLEGWRKDVTVVVDDATIWYDDGKQGRPDELYDDTLVRVIGVQESVTTTAAATEADTAEDSGETAADEAGATPTAVPEEEPTAVPTVMPTVSAEEAITATEDAATGEGDGGAEDQDSTERDDDEKVVRAILITPGRRGF